MPSEPCGSRRNFLQDEHGSWHQTYDCGGSYHGENYPTCPLPKGHSVPRKPDVGKEGPTDKAQDRWTEMLVRYNEVGGPKFCRGWERYGGITGKPGMLAELEHENIDSSAYLFELRSQLESVLAVLTNKDLSLAERADRAHKAISHILADVGHE